MEYSPNSAEARDIAYHMHGYTNAIAHKEKGPLVLERGEGVHVFDIHGNRYIEAMSGLWSAGLGFNHPRLIEAATQQLKKLPFYHNFTHKSHSNAIDLAEKLVSIAPNPMSKVYFTNSGSEANDTVVKLLWYRSNSLGKPEKKKIISRRWGYHGVTIAAASMTAIPNNQRSFDLPIDRFVHTTCPHYWKEGEDGESEEEFATRCANDLDALIQAEGPDTIAGFIAEPVMGAGGVIVPPATYWEKIQAVLQKYDIILIADEVICGFGRTGKMFACETFDIKADVMVLSKQITSSYVPFSAILMNERMYDPIAEESGRIGVLGHGYTGGSHPVGAAVALETIKVIEEEGLVQNSAEMGEMLRAGLQKFRDHPLVGEVRGAGFLAAVELAAPDGRKEEFGPGKLGGMMLQEMQDHGIIQRNIIDSMAFCPPMISDEKTVAQILDATEKSLEGLSKNVG